MTQHNSPTAHSRSIISQLAQRPRVDCLGPIAARFVYSLRLIALHERARRDPVPELTLRLGSVEVAAKALALFQAIGSTWPETVHVSRFCCHFLTHDEATIGGWIDAVVDRDSQAFEDAVAGLIRPDRTQRLWDSTLDLVSAEIRCA